MDPNATLAAWLENRDAESRKALNAWIAQGGFAPRIQVHPATDTWMRGDRYGAVVKLGTKYATVKLDRSGRTVQFVPQWILEVLR